MTSISRAALVALMTVALLSCGGKEVTADGFVSAVGATCRNANEQLDLIPSPSPAGRGDQQEALADYLQRALRVNEQAADSIRALAIPEDLSPDRDALVEAMTEANEGLKAAGAAAANGDQDALGSAVAAMAAGQNRFRSIAQRLGIEPCVSGGVPTSP